MQHFDLEPEEMHNLFEEVKQRSALKQAGAAVLKGTLRNLWRDGMADVVFQRLLAKVRGVARFSS